ncbi:MAG: NUDIX domain-containing protein, partial [Lachnospiraceae bacterium]|nr:NUDIX domain-containing protein [Lachnospiraceae bacterium]
MKLIDFKKVKDGKFIKNYELKYLNNDGREKVFEIISHNDYTSADELGQRSSGVSIVALDEKCENMLILKEFRMGVNKQIYNLCAGRMEKGESVEDCIRRELMEEAGLKLERVVKILPPSFAAVALSDIKNQIAIVVVSGTPTGKNASANEWIEPAFYS